MDFCVRAFDPSAMRACANVVIVGKRSTGKTTLCKDLLARARARMGVWGAAGGFGDPKNRGLAINATDGYKPEYGRLFEPKRVLANFSDAEAMLAQVVLEQKAASATLANMPQGRDPDIECCVVFDNCIYEAVHAVAGPVREMFAIGHHIGIGVTLALSYPLGIPPTMRSEIDYVFVFREPVPSNRRRIYENYCAAIPGFDVFCGLLDGLTRGPYECMVVDCTARNPARELRDYVFYYKARHVDAIESLAPFAPAAAVVTAAPASASEPLVVTEFNLRKRVRVD